MSSIFGGGAPANTNTGGAGGGLFGSANNQSSNTGARGLFGSSTQTNTAASGGGGLFGSNAPTNATAGGGGALFGSSTTQAQNTGGSSLFGGTNQNTTNNQSSLFGNTNQTQTQSTTNAGSLFGGGGSSLFGGSTQQQQPSQQQQASSSLFGGAGAGQNQQQSGFKQSSFNPQTVTIGGLGHTMTHAQFQRLQFSGASTVPNEKSITKQITTVKEKWNPQLPRTIDPNAPNNMPTTILKTYLYNAVPKEYAPFFYPDESRGEDEKSWEEALSQRPELPKIDGQEVTTLTYVPILCVGFKALGQRIETQAKIIEEMRIRLHEMNNSLSAVMAAHQQRITVKINSVKKQHEILSQRCLRLAVKVQVLRNRGYALDAQEESLRKTLLSLEKQVADPGFIGREDEIWARMVSLRERTRWLEEEGKRVAGQVQDHNRNAGSSGGISEEVLAKTRKLLKDYDGQLQHLNKEFEDVKKEYAAWEETQRVR